MAGKASTPILVGVGDIKNKSDKVDDAQEPAALMLAAIRHALVDTGLENDAQQALLDSVDRLSVVATWTLPYTDLPGLLSAQAHINPTTRILTEHGGNNPGLQCDESARAVSKREARVAILTGGEALASGKLPTDL